MTRGVAVRNDLKKFVEISSREKRRGYAYFTLLNLIILSYAQTVLRGKNLVIFNMAALVASAAYARFALKSVSADYQQRLVLKENLLQQSPDTLQLVQQVPPLIAQYDTDKVRAEYLVVGALFLAVIVLMSADFLGVKSKHNLVELGVTMGLIALVSQHVVQCAEEQRVTNRIKQWLPSLESLRGDGRPTTQEASGAAELQHRVI